MEWIIIVLSGALIIAAIIVILQRFEISELNKQISHWRGQWAEKQKEVEEIWRENTRLKTELERK